MSNEIYRGKISTFGGPRDTGVALDEGLALIETVDLDQSWWFWRLFLPYSSGMGLARRLNPNAYYIAMRFDYGQHPREVLRRAIFRLTNPRNSHSLFAQAADWGPNKRTGRICDMSPGCATALALKTDDEVVVEMILP
jgi:hypothetical protein